MKTIKVIKPKASEGPTYGPAGEKLREWLLEQYDVSDAAPLSAELCVTADRLYEIRQALAEPGLSVMDRCHLISAEVKLQAVFCRLWRLSGMADKEAPIPYPNPGRPAESDREARRRG